MAAVNYMEEMELKPFAGKTAEAPPKMYAALSLSKPTAQGSISEVAYAGYARQECTLTIPEEFVDTGGNFAAKCLNASILEWPVSSSNAGTALYVPLFDSLTGGNCWCYFALDEGGITINPNVQPSIPAGECVFISSGRFSKAYRTQCLNLLRGVSIPGFTTYAALYNGDPDNGGIELSGDGYARQPVPFADPFAHGGYMQITNSADVEMPRALTPWGMWTHTAFMTGADATGYTAAYQKENNGNPITRQSFVRMRAGRITIASR